MIEVEMTDDIRKYETKSIGPFTTRQAVCLIIGVVLGAPLAILIPVDIVYKIVLFCVGAALPFICGFIKMDGAHAEVVLIRMAYKLFITPTKRKYKLENSFRKAMETMEKKEEQARYANMSVSQQKAYRKKKEKKQIRYSNKKGCRIYH